MFINKPVKTTLLDTAIADAHKELASFEAHTDEYAKVTDQLQTLYKIKAEDKPDRVSKDALVGVLGSLAGILVIVSHERAHVLTSKALSFVGKF